MAARWRNVAVAAARDGRRHQRHRRRNAARLAALRLHGRPRKSTARISRRRRARRSGVLSKEQLTIASTRSKRFDGTVDRQRVAAVRAAARLEARDARRRHQSGASCTKSSRVASTCARKREGTGFDKQASFRLALDESARHAAQRARARRAARVQRDAQELGRSAMRRRALRRAHASRSTATLRDTIDARWSLQRPCARSPAARTPQARFESSGSASGALQVAARNREAARREPALSGWLARAAHDRRRCRCCRAATLAPVRAGAPSSAAASR